MKRETSGNCNTSTTTVLNKTMWAYILCCIMLICYFFTSDNQSEHSFYFLNYILGIVVLAPLNTVLIFILYKIGHADIYNWKHLIGENIIYLLYIHFTTVSASFLRSMLSDSFKEWFDYTVPFFPLVFTLVTMLLYYTSKNRKKKG